MRRKYVTLKDVANLAGVSVATVSFVLNKTKNNRISEETCARVMEAAKELNYRPDINAQMLKGKASSAVGLVVPCLSNYFYPEMTEGVTDRANELGYNIVLFHTNDNFQKELFSFDTLISMHVAGIIMVGVVCENETEELALIRNTDEHNMPVICVDRYHSASVVPTVSIDQEMAAYEITKRLILDGHARIALVMSRVVFHTMQQRIDGVARAMKDSGLAFDKEDIFFIDTVDLKNSDVDRCVGEILSSPKAYTTIFSACGDQFAIEVFLCLRRRGVKIPQNISLAGFDGIYLGEIINPTLSTVVQPIYDIGYEAMSMLDQRILRQKIPNQSLRLPYHVRMRESTRRIR